MSTLLGRGVAQGETPTPVPESIVERMMQLAQEDPAALMQFLSTQDPAMAGAAFTSVLVQSPQQIAYGVIGLARLNASAIGGILAAGPGTDPAALAAIGEYMPVDAWLPDDVPAAGEDRHGNGFWESMGSGELIESGLGKFTRPISNARLTVSDIPVGTLANLDPVPDGFTVASFLSLGSDGYLESDFIVGHVTFFLEKSWLQSNNIHEWTAHMMRFDEPTTTWIPVQAKRVREDESRVYFSAVLSSFSKWVIGGYSDMPAPQFRIDGLTVSGETKTNEPLTIQVTATNLTSRDADLSLPLWVNGQVHSAAAARLGPDEKRPIVFTLVPRNAGESQVRVDRLVSIINVAQGVPPTPTPVPVLARPEPTERGSGLDVGYIVGGLAGLLIALTAVAAFAGSRRKGEA